MFDRRTQVIVVLDVVESVRLMEQDEHGFIRRWHDFVEFARQQVLPQHRGRMHKSLGDGLMLEFSDAQDAIRALFALQGWCRQTNASLSPDRRLHLRAGAHLAEFLADSYDIYGTGINLTARVASLAGPDEIVVTADVRDQLAAGLDAEIEDLGECHLKHVKEPVRAYRVGAVGAAPVIGHGLGIEIPLRPTIAVIPFQMKNGEPGHELVGEALADEVIAALSRTSELHVISRLSTTVFRGRQSASEEIQHHLGATYILSGSCRTAGDRLALFVELIEAKSGHVAWAQTFRGRIDGLFLPDDALIAELVAGVSGAVMVTEVRRAKSHALPTLEGYTLLLGAIALMHRNSLADLDRAKAMLEHLIERNRRHPVGHAWLAKLHVLRVQQGWFADRATEARTALECSRRALEADPDSSLALTIDGFVHTNLMKDLKGASNRYAQALEINPNESLAWLLTGTLNAFQGDGERALEASERALRLSPLDPLRYFYDSLAATAAITAGEYQRAIALAERSLKANRFHTSTYRTLAIAQSLSGDTEGARNTISQLLEREPAFTAKQFLERTPATPALAGRVAEALIQAGLPRE